MATVPAWTGFGLAVRAYQSRAREMIDAVAAIGRARGLRFMIRRVKGAYWDGEIKRVQEVGLAGYPVFTRKHHADIAHLACARSLVDHPAVILPQFATHNAGTIAAILQMAEAARRSDPNAGRFEMQRLYGMGEGVFREVMAARPALNLRIYAPVGEHRDLLACLVRRLLENGANPSFVHQLTDAGVALEDLLRSPLRPTAAPGQPAPATLYGAARANSRGLDLTVPEQRAPVLAAVRALMASPPPAVPEVPAAQLAETVHQAMTLLAAGFAARSAASPRRNPAGLAATALPVTRAAATWPAKIANGKFHGEMQTNTPRPCSRSALLSPVGPGRVIGLSFSAACTAQ